MANRRTADTAARAKMTPTASSSSDSADISTLLEKVFERVSALDASERGATLFPHGVNSLRIAISVGNSNVDVTFNGPLTTERPDILSAATGAVRAQTLPSAFTEPSFILLPQVSGNGYYSYSPSPNQFGTEQTVSATVDVGRQWQISGRVSFGVGDISLAQGGPMPGHTTGHQRGRSVDVRPMRNDDQAKPVTWQDTAYSRELTQLLVDSFRAHANCSKIFFNDPNINGVQPLTGHDNHLHVEMLA